MINQFTALKIQLYCVVTIDRNKINILILDRIMTDTRSYDLKTQNLSSLSLLVLKY